MNESQEKNWLNNRHSLYFKKVRGVLAVSSILELPYYIYME